MKIKILKPGSGLKSLISYIVQVKRTADVSASAVAELNADFQGLAERTQKAITDMDALKQDKASSAAVTIAADAWAQDETEGYPYYCDLAVEDVTVNDRADVTISPSGLGTAFSCGMCPTSETLEGKIRIRAAGMPEKDIPAEYRIEKGEE